MYGDFHVKDKMAVIFNMGIAIPGKTVFLIETAPWLCVMKVIDHVRGFTEQKYNSTDEHIEAETKWPSFRRRHFQTHFLERKSMNFDSNFTKACS